MKKENSDELLDEFYLAYRNRKYNEAILSLKDIIQEERKDSFWLYSTLSSCYYELKDYKKALLYAKKAYKLKPNSPLVLWDYASVLIMLKKEKKGIARQQVGKNIFYNLEVQVGLIMDIV